MQHEEEHHEGGESDRDGRRCKPRSVNQMWLSYSFQICLVFLITSWTPCSVKCMSDRISKPIPSVDLKFTSLSPAFIYAQRGDTITLNCSGTSTLSSSSLSSTATTSLVPSSSSTTQLFTSWRFEGEDIPPKDSRRILHSNGSLSITKFSPSRKRRRTKFLLRSLPSSSSWTLKDLAGRSTSDDSKKWDEGRYFCVIKNSEGALLSRPIDIIASRECHELSSYSRSSVINFFLFLQAQQS